MSLATIAQFALFLGLVVGLALLLGPWLARVFAGEPTLLDLVLKPVERLLIRMIGRAAKTEMTWRSYAQAFIGFSLVGTLLLYAVLRLASYLPGGPEAAVLTTPLSADLSMNTAVSFATTTTWQAYAGESTMPYLAQLIGLTAQNFLGGAAGLAVGIAFIRGFARAGAGTLGNFWVDLVRAALWVLLPASIIGSAFLVTQGVPMSFDPYTHATTLEGGFQIIAQGPVAALEFIKNLGTNGGGFFNANGAHPYATPTPITEFVAMLAIAVLPAAIPIAFGHMVKRRRAGYVVLGAMLFLFVAGLAVCQLAESGNSLSLEGKEARFGVADSVLAAVTTSNGATGSYAAMHDSFTPIGVLVPLVNMMLGECALGGLGTGLYSLVMVALLGAFVTGLMIGRTPEFVGKRLGIGEMKLIAIYMLMGPLAILVPTAVAAVTQGGLAGLTTNQGRHGLTEILFAFTSSMANNGQSMAGLSANSPFYNIATAASMLIGRFGLAVPALALAGRFAAQKARGEVRGALPVDTVMFGAVIVVTALIFGALTFFPALVLGPIAEHFGAR
jgi:potassium-transporting ATPase potassium-binding subunit